MDHVPPRSIFPQPLPTGVELVSAPACERCHAANEKDDATIRNFLVSTEDSERHPAVIGSLAGKRDRSLKRSLERSGKDFHDMLQTMMVVDVKTPAGINLGKGVAFDFDNPVMNRFVERLARALLWYEYKQPFFPGAFGWRLNIELPPQVYDGMQHYGRIRKVTDVFAYGLTQMKDSSPAWIVANFYGCIEFLIRTVRTESTVDQ